MAGHSKWKNIRIRKGKQDSIRGKLFTKLTREIIIAAKMGGGDPSTNARLRVAIQKARDNSMPADNIKRGIQRGTGEIEGVQYDEIVYEGYGPNGSAIIVECYTENRNRTVADLRYIFSKNGGNLSESGSVAWQFKHIGQIILKREANNEDEITLKALEAGADDISSDDENFFIYTAIESLHATHDKLCELDLEAEDVELVWIPINMAELNKNDTEKLLKLLDALDDHDDVKETYVNVNISDEISSEVL